MAVIVKNCCCGCKLHTGVIIIALFYMAALSYTIYNNINTIKTLRSAKDVTQAEESVPDAVKQHYDGIIRFSVAAAVIHGIQLLVSLFLLLGAINKNRSACLVWIGFTILVMIISTAYLIFLVSIWSAFWAGGWIIIAENVLVIYFLIVVYSYAELLKEEAQGGGQPARHRNVQNVKEHVVTVPYPMGNQPTAYTKN